MLPAEKRIETVLTGNRVSGNMTYDAVAGPVADPRTVAAPRRAKSAEKLDAVTTYGQRCSYIPARLHVDAGKVPAVRPKHRHYRLYVFSEVCNGLEHDRF